MEYAIYAHQGMGPIRFGITQEEAIALLGKPERVVHSLNAVDNDYVAFYYDDLELTLFFEGDVPVLVCIDITSPEVTLEGHHLCDKSQQQIERLIKQLGYGPIDEMEIEDDMNALFVDGESIDFYFEQDELVSVTIGA